MFNLKVKYTKNTPHYINTNQLLDYDAHDPIYGKFFNLLSSLTLIFLVYKFICVTNHRICKILKSKLFPISFKKKSTK